MNETCQKIERCIACDSDNLKPVLDLNSQPLANSYRDGAEENLPEFPLAINVCADCFHTQLTHKVNPDLLFKNYLYVSGTTKTQIDYFDWFVSFVDELNCKTSMAGSYRVLDIGCNDGSQLNAFKKKGWVTAGIDPAKNLYELSSINHNVICDYFSEEHTNLGYFDTIVCQNAFAHNYDQYQFLINASKMMHEMSLLYISTSQVDMILNGEFDTIYHEHLSFYTIKSMNALCQRAGLFLVDVVRNSIHGNSYIFIISKNKNRYRKYYIQNMIAYENSLGLHDLKTYENYAKSCEEKARSLNNYLKMLRSSNDRKIPVIGFGAPAKGNTLMNFMKNGPDFIIDENALKQGKWIPGLDIQIHGMNHLETFCNEKKLIFIPLAWNFYNEIVGKIKSVRSNHDDDFVKYFPEFTIQK